MWIQVSTVGSESARSLAELADVHDVAYLDAPVSGSTEPARKGEFVWLADRIRSAGSNPAGGTAPVRFPAPATP